MSISYIIHASILIAIFCGSYYLLLSKATFFKLNRAVLLLGIFASFLLPFVPAPVKLSYQGKQIESSTAIQKSLQNIVKENSQQNPQTIQQDAKFLQPEISVLETGSSRRYDLSIIPTIYLIGVIILLLNLFFQFFSLGSKIFKYSSTGSSVIKIPYKISPCSFFGYTLIEEDMPEGELKDNILMHERIHAQQWHSLDILLAELLVVALWFNPFAWMYRKAVESNLEFLADNGMIDQNIEKKKYQYNLLQLAVPNFPLSIVTNYNQTLIKKRITMMNTKKSSTRIGWKYLLYIPIMIFTITLLNPSALKGLDALVDESQKLILIITGNTSKQDLTRLQSEARLYGYSLNVNDVKWKNDNKLKSIKYELHFDSETSMSQRSTIHDLNRFHSFFVYKDNTGSGGVVGAEVNKEFIESEVSNASTNQSEYIVLASFLNGPMSFKNFIGSKLLEENNALFEKEKKWFTLFKTDLKNKSSKNIYQINGADYDISKVKDAMELGEVLDIKVDELDNEIFQFNIFIKNKTGYHMELSSGIRLPANNPTMHISQAISNLQEQLKECGVSKATYFLDGLETKMTLENFDTVMVKKLTIESGSNFDDNGVYLGKEVRVIFKTI